jgi:hypothetical protein
MKFKESSVFVSKVERVNYWTEMKHWWAKTVTSVFVEAMKAHWPSNKDLDISTDTESEDMRPGPGAYIDINKHSIFNVEKNPDAFFGR